LYLHLSLAERLEAFRRLTDFFLTTGAAHRDWGSRLRIAAAFFALTAVSLVGVESGHPSTELAVVTIACTIVSGTLNAAIAAIRPNEEAARRFAVHADLLEADARAVTVWRMPSALTDLRDEAKRKVILAQLDERLARYRNDYIVCMQHSAIARRGLGQALNDLVADGWLTEANALDLVEPLRRGNAQALFPIFEQGGQPASPRPMRVS
jgi:hypothetical protein